MSLWAVWLPMMNKGGCIAKAIALQADYDERVAGVQLERFCAGGLDAVNTAAQKVMSGWDQLIVAGGVESMSRLGIADIGGPLMNDPQLATKVKSVPQGIGGDLLATLDGRTREEVDSFAMESQKRAAHARDNGYFDKSVIPVKDQNGFTILEKDDYIRPDTTMEQLALLKPAFEQMGAMGFDDIAITKFPELKQINHLHTAGNSSGIVDGASAVLIGNEKIGSELSLTPRARIVAGAVVASDPTLMATGPIYAVKKCLATAGLKIEDIELWECNEAFASVPLHFMDQMKVPHEILNVNGGAIGLGHPIGATGAMLLGTLLDEMERRNLKRGMVTLCAAAGIGIATIIERV